MVVGQCLYNMKLGILTFHSQLNYGGVLQCWALKTSLEGMGHEVVVVDRWHYPDNRMLRREFATLTAKGWVKLLIRGLLGCGDFGKLMRTIRTIRFVRGLGLTKEHFCDWSEVKHSNLQTFEHLDVLIVGSDQVWHCGDWGDPRPYLLEGAPEVRAISYAASFGMAAIPDDQVELYKRGLGRFAALSCREKEGVEICRGLGYGATHVVDPTLLVDPLEWRKLAGDRTIKESEQSNNRKLVCYFMSVDMAAALPLLENFAAKMNCTVEVLTNEPFLRPIPKSIHQLLSNFRSVRVKICRGYGPGEFVRAFASATWVLTDSFHAVMFSSIFNCNARFLRPANEMRRAMFARIEEFSKECGKGDLFVDGVVQALQSFERGKTMSFDFDQIVVMRNESMAWLQRAIAG